MGKRGLPPDESCRSPSLLCTNTMFVASLDRTARSSPTDPRNTVGLSLQSVPAAWCLQHKKNKGKSRGRGRERHDAQHSTVRESTQNCLCLHTFAKEDDFFLHHIYLQQLQKVAEVI